MGTAAPTRSSRRAAAATAGRSAVRELAESVVAELRALHLELAFGLPGGGSNLDVIGALEAAGGRFVLAHTETAAVIMAGVAAELSGHPVGAVVTRGPGVASAVNGMGQALLDRQTVVLLADLVTAAERHRISHQRLDHAAVLGGVVKLSAVVGTNAPGATARGAVLTGLSGRPGPVHLDLDPTTAGDRLPAVGKRALRTPSAQVMGELAKRLGAARRPVAVAGVGIRAGTARDAAIGELRRLAAAGLPVLTTYKGRGAVPDGHPAMAGVVTGARLEAPVLQGADLILGVGLDPVELLPTEWPYQAPVVLVGPWAIDDPSYFCGRLVQEVVGDLGGALGGLADRATGWEGQWARSRRAEAVTALRDAVAPSGSGLNPVEVVVQARREAPPGTMATVDSGAHMLAAMELWEVDEPGQLLISGGLATMGFALPAAVGAAVARPGTPVVCLTGDGGLGMALAELETLARLDLPVVVVVFNDACLSLIALKQQPEGQGGEAAVRYRETDFAALARSMGLRAWRVSGTAAYRRALRAAFAGGGPALIDAVVDPTGYRAIMGLVRGGAWPEVREGRRAPGKEE